MNLLSLLAAANAFGFVVLGIKVYRLNPRERLNRLALLLYCSIVLWATTYSQLYGAPTADLAMLWHKIGSIGGILFCALTAHFFLILSEQADKLNRALFVIILYTMPAIMIIRSFAAPGTVIASGMIQSTIGWGWTYQSNIDSPWFWIYFIFQSCCFSLAIYSFIKWVKKNRQNVFTRGARNGLLLCAVMLFIGILTDLALPSFLPLIPPVCVVMMFVWSFWLLKIVKRTGMFGIMNSATPELILQTVMSPILLLNENETILLCNQATLDLLKFEREQVVGRSLQDFIKIRHDKEIQLVDSLGDIIDVQASFSPIENEQEDCHGTVLCLQDITQMKKVEQELSWRNDKYRELSEYLERVANYDDLTDMPNRWLFFKKLDQAIAEYQLSGVGFALVFIDLDGFKSVNDQFGHNIGDQLLVAVSKIFLSSVRKDDLIARIGGDEFVLFFSHYSHPEELDRFVQRLTEKFEQPIEIGEHFCRIRLSTGISCCPEDADTTDELVRVADQRMYQNKDKKHYVG